MRHFATLFDYAYSSKGLSLHESLSRHSKREPFLLHILAMDDKTVTLLNELALPNVEVLPLDTFERALHLEPVRASRNWAEYCWTVASSLMEYLLPWSEGDITYIDADCAFYFDPAPVFEAIGSASIAISPHRFIPSKAHLAVNGIYNVGWVTIRNTSTGRECLTQWAADCREWCFNRHEPGRFGDQRYLDVWPGKYGSECHILDIGVNVGPWNLANWKLEPGPLVNGQPVVTYHFHEFKNANKLTNYELRPLDRSLIYGPYVGLWTSSGVRIADVEKKLAARQAEMALQAERA